MEYILSFLEGILTFVSPCLLPMLPVYLLYFAGNEKSSGSVRTAVNALGFIVGFTLVFVALGAFAAFLGGLLLRHQTALNLATGSIVILLGLHYLGWVKIPLLYRVSGRRATIQITGFLQAMLFGLVFSISWTPCVGAFLGSALMLASQQGSVTQGILMLLCYSVGLGIPFLLSALLVDKLKEALNFIKRHYNIVVKASGALLVVTGILMATGMMGRLLGVLQTI